MLSWLYGQVSSLWRAVSKVSGRISSEVSSALSSAKSYARDVVNGAVRALEKLIARAEDTAQKLVKAAIRIAQDLFETAREIIAKTEKAVIAKINEVRSLAEDWVQGALKTAAKWLAELEYRLQKVVKLAVQELRALFIPWLGEIQQLLDYWKGILSLFIANPLGFILGIIQDVFLEWASYLVAYGLGTIKYTLPPMPFYGFTGTSPVTGPGPGSPLPSMPPPSGGDESRFANAPGWLKDLIAESFPAGQRGNALDVAYMESGWNASAVNDTRARADGECNQPYTLSDGRPALTELSVGLFQINVCAHGGSESHWRNPENNVEKAGALFAASGWRPWRYSADKLGL